MAVRHDADPKALMAAQKREASKPGRDNPSGRGAGLTPKVQQAIELMVFGDDEGKFCPNDREAAVAVGLTVRSIREAMLKPAVAAYFAQQIAARRAGLKPLGLQTIEGIMSDPKLKETAAGAKARIEAAKVVLVEPAGSQVNVQVNNSLSVTPGYVIKLNRGRTDLSDVEDVFTIDAVNAEGENSHG